MTRISGLAITALLSLSALVAPAVVEASSEATVIIARDCDYILLDAGQGQVLIKLIQGERPKSGDRLSGAMQRGFSEFTNRRTQESIQVWVDMVDRGGTRALMRYGQYCN